MSNTNPFIPGMFSFDEGHISFFGISGFRGMCAISVSSTIPGPSRNVSPKYVLEWYLWRWVKKTKHRHIKKIVVNPSFAKRLYEEGYIHIWDVVDVKEVDGGIEFRYKFLTSRFPFFTLRVEQNPKYPFFAMDGDGNLL